MPVLIVGASCDVGRRLADLLLAQDAQVRIYVREEDADLRAAGCKVAVGELDDLGRLESAMEQVHTVVDLVGGAEPERGRSVEWHNEELTDVAVRAAVSADVTRFLALSELGADAASENRYLAARGRADALVQRSGLQYAVLRCAPIIGAGTPLGEAIRRARARRVPIAPGDGAQRLTPVGADDVAGALLAADSREAAVNGVFEFGGPDTVSFDDLLRTATGHERIAHRKSMPGLDPLLAQAWSSDRCADATPFLAQFPVRRTSIAAVLRSL